MLELREGLYSNLPHHAAEILQQRVPGAVQQREAVLHGHAGQRMPGMRNADPAERRSRALAPFLRRRLPYPVVDGLSESKSVFGGKATVVRMLRAGAAYGSEKVLQPCLLSRVYLKTPNVTDSENFCVEQDIFSQEY